MASSKLKLEIVTPEGVTTSEEVNSVTLPGGEGELGIYPGHVPLMTPIVAGHAVVHSDSGEYLIAVGDGFAEITPDRVSVLIDMAVKADSIDEAAAEEARRKAEARLQEKMSDEEMLLAQTALAQAMAQIETKRLSKSLRR